jgi:hypothetical protein
MKATEDVIATLKDLMELELERRVKKMLRDFKRDMGR